MPRLPRPHGVLSIDGDAITATFSYDANGNQTAANGSNLSRLVAYRPTTSRRASPRAPEPSPSPTTSTTSATSRPRRKNTTWYFDAFGIHAELVGPTGGWGWNDYLMVGGSIVGVRFLQGSTVTLRYFHQDSLGSIAVLTDPTGVVVERDAYNPWGKRRFPNGNDDTTDSITSQTIRGFTGQGAQRFADPASTDFGLPRCAQAPE